MTGFLACHIGSFVLGRIPVVPVCCTLLAGALGLSLVRHVLHLTGHLVVALVLLSCSVVVLHVQLVQLLMDHLVA